METANSFLNDLTQITQNMEEEENMLQSMNAALDKQIEQDMQAINNILKINRMVPTPPPKLTPKPSLKPPPKPLTDFERIEQQIMDDEFDLYQSMNAELDKQIAKDMKRISDFLDKAGEKIDIAKRIEFFNSMEALPAGLNNPVSDHILYQHTPLGNIKWHECGQCSFKSTEQRTLKEHILTRHGAASSEQYENEACKERVEICENCGSVHENKSDLLRHMSEKHGVEVQFKCKQCAFIGEDQSSLRQHTLSEHVKLNVSWYKCAHCAYRTVRKTNLDRHIMYKHSGSRIFI